jgi:hypothetical protein
MIQYHPNDRQDKMGIRLGANDLSGLIITTERVCNETSRHVARESDFAIYRGIWRLEKSNLTQIEAAKFNKRGKQASYR